MIKQMSFFLNKEEDIENIIQQVQEAVGELRACKAMYVMHLVPDVIESRKDVAQYMQDAICARWHYAQVVTAAVAQSALDGHLSPASAEAPSHVSPFAKPFVSTITFTLFEETSVRVIPFDFHRNTCEEVGKALLGALDADVQVRAVQLFVTGKGIDYTPLFAEVSQCHPNIVFFGGIAHDDSVGWSGMLATRDMTLTQGMVFVLFSGPSLYVETASSFGWKPLGHTMTVTGMDGNLCVTELDHRPAAEIYDFYLGVRDGDNFFSDAMTFPLHLERSGMVLARHPRYLRNDGGMGFASDIHLDEQVRLAYGDLRSILQKASGQQMHLLSFQPQVTFVISCVARRWLLQQHVEEELSVLRQLSPFAGFYSYGEFTRSQGNLVSMEMTLIYAAMREGEPTHEVKTVLLESNRFQQEVTIATHLVHLIEAMTEEWNARDARLRDLAEHDALTHLLNRGAAEQAIVKTLLEMRASGKCMALLMIDLDDFKAINDTFGHSSGDAVLIALADVLRSETKEHTDLVGRWGGDEFFVVLPNVREELALRIAERIRSQVALLTILPNCHTITVSIGVVVSNECDTPERIIQRADRGLYASKNVGGKNCVTQC